MSDDSSGGGFEIPLILKQVTNLLVHWEQGDPTIPKNFDDKSIEACANSLVATPSLLDDLTVAIGLNEIAERGQMFRFISRAAYSMHYGKGRDFLMGLLWATAYEKANGETRQALLSGIISDRDFFTPLHSLPHFVKHSGIPSGVLSDWLVQVRERMGESYAEGFWEGINALALCRPQQAVEVLTLWIANRPSEIIIPMAVTLLAALRAVEPPLVAGLEQQLSGHPDEMRRVVFHRSWTVFNQTGKISTQTYKSLIERMSSGTPAEHDEAFRFVRCSLERPDIADEKFAFGIRWMHAHAPVNSSDEWLHWSLHLALVCDDRAAQMGLPLFREMLPRLLPIPEKNKGTWRELQSLLVHLLKSNPAAFETFLFEITCQDRNGISFQFSEMGCFSNLSVLLRKNAQQLVINALTSLSEPIRHLGLTIFNHLALDVLPVTPLSTWSDDWLAVLIFQLRTEIVINDFGSRFLCALLPRVQLGSEGLHNLFIEELVWHIKDFPACLEQIKKLAESLSNDLLKRAVRLAEDYFSNLKSCYGHAINSMEVAGYRRAQRLETRKRSRQISTAAEESSPLFSMIHKSYLLYGGAQWRTYAGGNFMPASGLNEYSNAIHFPRLPMLDPEGCSQRRRYALRQMSRLIEKEDHRRKSQHDS